MPATLTRSPTGRGAAGLTSTLIVDMERRATRRPDTTENQLLVREW